jgi:hypothetical protein
MSKNLIFAPKMTKLWACQISQNKKNTLYSKHGRIPFFDPCFRPRANTKRVLVFAFINKYFEIRYLFAFVLTNANEAEQGKARLRNLASKY